MTGSRLLEWRVGSRRFGTPVSGVREILEARVATRIPGTPAEILGLVNVRGTIITVIDGRTLFGEARAEDPAAILVLELEGRAVGVAVSEVLDLRDADQADVAGVEVPDLAAQVGPLFAPDGVGRAL